VLAIAAEAISFFAPDLMVWKIAGMAVAALAIWLAGIDTYRKGMAALVRGKLNINSLMSVAVTGAFLIGQWPEAAMVMALYAIAELIEAKAVDRARNAIKGLLELAPEEALVLGADGTWTVTPVASVAIGATVRIKPGERVSLDGTVTKGNSAINQAPVTGESIPVDKAPGDPVFAGTINETGELEFKVTASASPGQNHSSRRAGAGHARSDAALRRPVCRHLHPRCVRHRCGGSAVHAPVHGSELDGGAVQGAGFVGYSLSLRAGHFHTRYRRQRSGCGRAPGHFDQGRHLS
jgi:hypothetical protein